MSENLASPSKSASQRRTISDSQMLAQIEQWMATIRDLYRDQKIETQLRN